MASNGITGDLADEIYDKIEAFANFGFAESHAISFALLVYASGWLRLHYPAAFLAALLRAQPMGFYSPQSLVTDSRRHGVEVLRPCILRSGAESGLELIDSTEQRPTGMDACLAVDQPPIGEFDPSAAYDFAAHRRDGAFATRLGLSQVTSIGSTKAAEIVASRDADGPFRDLTDLVRRTGLNAQQMEALATAGAFDVFDLSRRQALWAAGPAADDGPGKLAGIATAQTPPTLPGMSAGEQTMADLWATHISTDVHPIAHVRDDLTARDVLPAAALASVEPGTRIRAGGVVTHRQRPSTAGGVTFLNLEDETGMVNVIVTTGVWTRFRRIAQGSAALIIRGKLERNDGAINLLADHIERLPITIRPSSRDFR
jgi:error-prone DNA polymerase